MHAYRTAWLDNPEHRPSDIDLFAGEILSSSQPLLGSSKWTDSTWMRRYRTGIQFSLLTVAKALGITSVDRLSQLRVLEIGCGSGQKAIGLSHAFHSYTGLDLSPSAIDRARNLARLLGRDNLEFAVVEAIEVKRFLSQHGGAYDVLLLYAVLEHLTIEERLDLLQTCWDHLPDEGVLVVVELPNRLCPFDHHSSELPFFDALPPELAILYGQRSPRKYFRDRLYGAADTRHELYRIGRGASYHEFELSIADASNLEQLIAVDPWSTIQLNHHPVKTYEKLLLRMFRTLSAENLSHRIPAGFSRYWIDLALTKTKSSAQSRPYFLTPDNGRQLKLGDREAYRTTEPLRVALPEQCSELCVGFERSSLASEVIVKDDAGEVLFECDGGFLRDSLGEHWNSVVYKSIKVRNGSPLRISSGSGDAVVSTLLARQ